MSYFLLSMVFWNKVWRWLKIGFEKVNQFIVKYLIDRTGWIEFDWIEINWKLCLSPAAAAAPAMVAPTAPVIKGRMKCSRTQQLSNRHHQCCLVKSPILSPNHWFLGEMCVPEIQTIESGRGSQIHTKRLTRRKSSSCESSETKNTHHLLSHIRVFSLLNVCLSLLPLPLVSPSFSLSALWSGPFCPSYPPYLYSSPQFLWQQPWLEKSPFVLPFSWHTGWPAGFLQPYKWFKLKLGAKQASSSWIQV